MEFSNLWLEEGVGEQEALEKEDRLLLVKQVMNDGHAGGDVIEPELFQFVVDSEMVNWSMKGGFSIGYILVDISKHRIGVIANLNFVNVIAHHTSL